MGDIASRFASAFRDYVTDGVPATGANDPSKPEIRAIGVAIDLALSGAAAGLKLYPTVAAMNADSQPDGTVMFVYANSGSAPDPANTSYRRANGASVLFPEYLNALQALVQSKVDAAATSATQAQAARDAAAASVATLQPALAVIDASQRWYDPVTGKQLLDAEIASDLSLLGGHFLDGTSLENGSASGGAGGSTIGGFTLDASERWYDPTSGKQIMSAQVGSDLSIGSATLVDGTRYPDGGLAGIAAWGDSLSEIPWVETLAAMLGGRAWYNGGFGGQTTPQINGRQGATSYPFVVAGNQIVAGPNTVQQINGAAITGMASAPAGNAFFLSTPAGNIWRRCTGALGSVHGTLTATGTGTGTPSSSQAYTFTPDVGAVLPASCPPGTPFVIDNPYDDYISIFGDGRNDFGARTLAQIAADDLAMVARLPHKRFLFWPIQNGSGEGIGSGVVYDKIIAIEAQRAAMFPRNFVPLRRLLIDQGIQVAIRLVGLGAGASPGQDLRTSAQVAQDNADITNDVCPTSLRAPSDFLHWNQTAGKTAVAYFFAQAIIAKGW